ncbi:MAG: DedA family protein [Steroidobacteraceae bacterium]|nr:DedA family protein [Steroidobacteraceae bacterium]
MELLYSLVDFIVHLDRHLVEMLSRYGVWIYAILFLIVFAETGLVVTPFLPGDSLLFGVGALAAVDTSGTLSASLAGGLLIVAAVLGNTTNYYVGRWIGPPAFSGRFRFLRAEHLRRTEEFYERYGALAIVVSRFVPIVRTFAPFVAGVGRMHVGRFQFYNVAGAVAWVVLFVGGGYLFGNLPIIRDNFGIVTVIIIVVSVLPIFVGWFKARRARSTPAAPSR